MLGAHKMQVPSGIATRKLFISFSVSITYTHQILTMIGAKTTQNEIKNFKEEMMYKYL